jgi:hypothetical protein
VPGNAHGGELTWLRLAIRYPKGKGTGRDKITTWNSSALDAIGSLVFNERDMTPEQLALFKCGSNWRHNPTLLKLDRSGVAEAICAQDPSGRAQSRMGFTDFSRGHVYQPDFEVCYPDGSKRLKTCDGAWVRETAALILWPLADCSSNWQQNPAALRKLPDGTTVGLCAEWQLPAKVIPPLPYGVKDCGLESLENRKIS